MADAFAAQGYLCLVLDTYNGDPVPPQMPDGFDIMKWLNEGSDGKNPHTSEATDQIVVAGINYLKDLGVTKIAAVGYCIGAKVCVIHCDKQLSSKTNIISASHSPLQKRHRRRIHCTSVLC
jgi:dienelactone hydrolase